MVSERNQVSSAHLNAVPRPPFALEGQRIERIYGAHCHQSQLDQPDADRRLQFVVGSLLLTDEAHRC